MVADESASLAVLAPVQKAIGHSRPACTGIPFARNDDPRVLLPWLVGLLVPNATPAIHHLLAAVVVPFPGPPALARTTQANDDARLARAGRSPRAKESR